MSEAEASRPKGAVECTWTEELAARVYGRGPLLAAGVEQCRGSSAPSDPRVTCSRRSRRARHHDRRDGHYPSPFQTKGCG